VAALDRHRVALWAVLGLCLAGLAATFLVALGASEVRRTGTNMVPAWERVGQATAGHPVCSLDERLPAGSGFVAIQLETDAHPAPPVRARVGLPGGRMLRGAYVRGWRKGTVRLPIPAQAHEAVGIVLCVESRGHRPVDVWGANGVIGAQYYEPRASSWYGFLGSLGDRLHQGRGSWIGGWALPLCIAFVLLAAAVAAATVVRADRAT
jgi:hypothetical protein